MKRLALATAACFVLLASATAAVADTTFTVSSPGSAGFPSSAEPNGPGSITVPFAFASPPERPTTLSYAQLLDLWHRAGAAYGVPWQVLAAINKVESNFGRNMGPSSAGALGWMQFMPGTWMRWGLDADHDGLADPWDPEDAVFAAARYLAAAGAHEDLARAVFAYNHADWYVKRVLDLAALFGSDDSSLGVGLGPGADAVFQLDLIEKRIAKTAASVTKTKVALPRARARINDLEKRVLVLEQRAGDPGLSDAGFGKLDAKIRRLERAKERTATRVGKLRAGLTRAVDDLRTLRNQQVAASSTTPGAASLDGAEGNGGYVFPVGGGPAVVSVAHTHHDYPAADIAAPEGSPVYALAASVVSDTYRSVSGSCGIGLKLRLETGEFYTYCHLSYLEPDVVPGAALAAGAPVGLVGQTGHATGPHLHLQLDPALSYPQEKPWFQSFAGTAFSWQDAPTPKPMERTTARARAASGTRVFSVVSRTFAPAGTRVVTFTR